MRQHTAMRPAHEVGARVRVDAGRHQGKPGVVVAVDPNDMHPYWVRADGAATSAPYNATELHS